MPWDFFSLPWNDTSRFLSSDILRTEYGEDYNEDEYCKDDRIESNLSKTKKNPPKAVIFSDFCCTFAMSLMILLVLICSTKVSKKSDMAKS